MRCRPPCASAVAFALALGSAACAQDAPAPLSGPALLARLRAADLGADEANSLADQTVTQPIAIRLQGTMALRERFLDRQKLHAKACQDAAAALAKALAKRTARDDKAAAAATETWRRDALAISRRDGLTKEIIHSEIDPLVAKLEEQLWPAREQLLAAHPDLDARCRALQVERAGLPHWFAAYTRSTSGLELHPDAEKHFAKHPVPPAPLPVAALDDEWVVWTMQAMPLSARDRKALEANEALRATSDPEEFAGTTEQNRIRWLLGLPLLRIDDKLTLAARDHSQDMVHLGFFAHESPVAGKRSPGDRAARFGTSAGAENIAQGHARGPDAIRGWWYSPGHHKNLLGNHARVGLGRSAQTWTQMFGG